MREKIIEEILDKIHAIKRTFSSGMCPMHKDCNLTITQATVLFMLKKHGQINLTELSTLLGISKSATTQLVNTLEKQGLVIRESDAIDKRVVRIKPSQKGVEYIETKKKVVFDKIYAIFETLDESELIELNKIMTKLINSKEAKK